MIYKTKKIKTSRIGRQYENTCIGCLHIRKEKKTDDEENVTNYNRYSYRCKIYEAMINMVRCIDYE